MPKAVLHQTVKARHDLLTMRKLSTHIRLCCFSREKELEISSLLGWIQFSLHINSHRPTPSKQIMINISGPGEIYIVQTRQSIDQKLSVFKFGRAADAEKRKVQYPKGTQMICRIPTSCMKDAEDYMKILCRSDLIPRPDFGSEYFQGDVRIMIRKLLQAADAFPGQYTPDSEAETALLVPEPAPYSEDISVLSQADTCEDAVMFEAGNQVTTDAAGTEIAKAEAVAGSAVDPEIVPLPSSTDATALLITYVQSNIEELSRQPVDTFKLLDDVTTMLQKAGCKRRASPTFEKMTQNLRRYFGTKEIVAHRFSDGGLKHATTFKRPKLECLDLKSAVDKTTLNQFFEMSDKERSCIITRVEGRVTWLSDFKKRFEAKMGKGTYVADPTVFAGLGFRLSESRVNVCKTCKQLARGGCCAERGPLNRTFKVVIHDLEFTLLDCS